MKLKDHIIDKVSYLGSPSKNDVNNGMPIPLSGSAIANFIEMLTGEINRSDKEGGVMPNIE